MFFILFFMVVRAALFDPVDLKKILSDGPTGKQAPQKDAKQGDTNESGSGSLLSSNATSSKQNLSEKSGAGTSVVEVSSSGFLDNIFKKMDGGSSKSKTFESSLPVSSYAYLSTGSLKVVRTESKASHPVTASSYVHSGQVGTTRSSGPEKAEKSLQKDDAKGSVKLGEIDTGNLNERKSLIFSLRTVTIVEPVLKTSQKKERHEKAVSTLVLSSGSSSKSILSMISKSGKGKDDHHVAKEGRNEASGSVEGHGKDDSEKNNSGKNGKHSKSAVTASSKGLSSSGVRTQKTGQKGPGSSSYLTVGPVIVLNSAGMESGSVDLRQFKSSESSRDGKSATLLNEIASSVRTSKGRGENPITKWWSRDSGSKYSNSVKISNSAFPESGVKTTKLMRSSAMLGSVALGTQLASKGGHSAQKHGGWSLSSSENKGQTDAPASEAYDLESMKSIYSILGWVASVGGPDRTGNKNDKGIPVLDASSHKGDASNGSSGIDISSALDQLRTGKKKGGKIHVGGFVYQSSNSKSKNNRFRFDGWIYGDSEMS